MTYLKDFAKVYRQENGFIIVDGWVAEIYRLDPVNKGFYAVIADTREPNPDLILPENYPVFESVFEAIKAKMGVK